MEFRDPTQPSPEMREAIEASQDSPAVGPGIAPAPSVPQIRLKARVFGTIAKPVALLDVNGQLVSVNAGGEVVVSNPGGGVSTLVIRELTVANVQIEILPLKKVLILR